MSELIDFASEESVKESKKTKPKTEKAIDFIHPGFSVEGKCLHCGEGIRTDYYGNIFCVNFVVECPNYKNRKEVR